MKALVVEDRKSLSARMRTHLEYACQRRVLSCELLFVDSLASALQTLEKGHPNLISIGGTLPEVSGGRPVTGAGLSILSHLDDTGFASPIVFFSASVFDVRRAKSRLVAGRRVLAYRKAYGKGKIPEGFANVSQWADICGRLLAGLMV